MLHLCLMPGVGGHWSPAAAWWTWWCSRFWSVDEETSRGVQCARFCEYLL